MKQFKIYKLYKHLYSQHKLHITYTYKLHVFSFSFTYFHINDTYSYKLHVFSFSFTYFQIIVFFWIFIWFNTSLL